MSEFFDALESRDPAQREAVLLAALPGHVAQAQRQTSAFAQILAGVDANAITSRAALAGLPVVRKTELFERQKALRADAATLGVVQSINLPNYRTCKLFKNEIF